MNVCLFSLDKKYWYCTKLNIIFWGVEDQTASLSYAGNRIFQICGISTSVEECYPWEQMGWVPKARLTRKQLSTPPPPGCPPIDRQSMAQFYTNRGTVEQHRGPGTQSQLQHNHTAALLSMLGAACPEIAHKAAHTNRREPMQSGVGSSCHKQAVLQLQCLLLFCTKNLVFPLLQR